MLRIHIDEESEGVCLALEGSLTGPWVAELEKCWQHAGGDSKVTLNLSCVTFVDDEGLDLLARMRRAGVALKPNGCLMRALVQKIEDEMRGEPGKIPGQGRSSNSQC